LEIWDISCEERYAKDLMRQPWYKEASLAVYCVDFSQNINQEQINLDIQYFTEINPHANLILAVTKADLCPERAEETLQAIQNKVFTERLSLSAMDDKSLALFLKKILFLSRKQFSNTIKAMNAKQVANLNDDLLACARDSLPKESHLYQSLNNFISLVQKLPRRKYQALGKEAYILINTLQEAKAEAIPAAIQAFSKNCYSLLRNYGHYAKIAFYSVLAAVSQSLVLAAAGFGVGFVLGLWGGPIAFLSGVATSILILIASACAGAVSGALVANSLFNKSKPAVLAFNAIVEKASEFENRLDEEKSAPHIQ
jgi:hypothetical protein